MLLLRWHAPASLCNGWYVHHHYVPYYVTYAFLPPFHVPNHSIPLFPRVSVCVHIVCLVSVSVLFNILNATRVDLATGAEHRTREGLVGNPLGGCSWGALLHHTINLLQGQTLGLGDEEVGIDESASAETAPDEEDGRFEVSVLFFPPCRV